MDTPNDNKLRYLLDRCLSGQETAEERAELDGYFESKQSQELLDAKILDAFYQEKKLVDIAPEKQEQILQAIYALEQIDRPIRKINYWKWAGVAALFLFILMPFLIDKTTITKHEWTLTDTASKHETQQKIVEGPAHSEDLLPAQEEAVLEMADGTRIALANLAAGKTFEREGVTMERSIDGSLVLRFLSDLKGNQRFANHIHTIRTPRGGTYKVVLSDGTIVHLNADSKLSFPTTFTADERRVTFEGEAYFDVAKDKKRQFIVVSGSGKQQQELRVYGTAFNLSAYPEEESVRTTLIEGSVKVKSVYAGVELFLKPNEEALLGTGGLTKDVADLDATLAWKNNVFYFADEPIEKVMSQISRWYDVDILYQGPVPTDKFWGQISRNKKLPELLEIVERMSKLKFDIRGKEVYILD
ncbi:FecR family protein [Sphingobacterium sp. UBA6645]|uniref:FecR family protein n=1 Tax=Sphingobacterium sp. UBA6645 TaxID=1947511 RepID=UPI0025F7F9C7|nr:FecR family protein [Sphingobacterium sp. UBA6645]